MANSDDEKKKSNPKAKAAVASAKKETKKSYDDSEFKSELKGSFDLNEDSIELDSTPEGGERSSYKRKMGKGKSYTERTSDKLFGQGETKIQIIKRPGEKFKLKDTYNKSGELVKSTYKVKTKDDRYKIRLK